MNPVYLATRVLRRLPMALLPLVGHQDLLDLISLGLAIRRGSLVFETFYLGFFLFFFFFCDLSVANPIYS